MLRALRTVRALIAENPLLAGIYSGGKAFAGPRQVHVDLTNRCTLRCVCCWHRSPCLPEEERIRGWDGWELSYDTVLRLVDDLAGLGVGRIVYSGGGDPLLHPRLLDIIRYTAAKKIDVRLITNLTCAREETIRALIEAGVAQLSVSLWAARPETYAALHPGCTGETFARVLGLIRTFARLRGDAPRPELIIMNVLTPANYTELGEMVSLGIELGATYVWFQPVDVQAPSFRRFLFTPAQLERLAVLIRETAAAPRDSVPERQRSILDFGLLLRRIGDAGAPRGWYQSGFIDSVPCYVGWMGGRVLANGDVVPCCKGERLKLGNVNRARYADIWSGDAYTGFREKASRLGKSDPYFGAIACGRMCDDWGENELVNHQYLQFLDRLRRLGPLERLLVNLRLRGRPTRVIDGRPRVPARG